MNPLQLIARALTGMDHMEMTKQERYIANILVHEGYLTINNRTQELESKTLWLEYQATSANSVTELSQPGK